MAGSFQNWKAKARNKPWPQKYNLATNGAQKRQTNSTWGERKKKEKKGPILTRSKSPAKNKPEKILFKLQLSALDCLEELLEISNFPDKQYTFLNIRSYKSKAAHEAANILKIEQMPNSFRAKV